MAQKKNLYILFLIIIIIFTSFIFWKLNLMDDDKSDSSNNEQYREWGVSINSAHMTEKKNHLKQIKLRDDYIHSSYHKDLTTAFYLNDGTWLRTLVADSSGKWGGNSSRPLGGNPFAQPLPERLKLTYYEMMEDKFYQLDTELPTEKIRQLFNTPDAGWEESYFEGEILAPLSFKTRDINIAVAPEGWIILFAVGSHGNRYEIGSWQAKEIEANYDADVFFMDNSIPIEQLQDGKHKAATRQKFLTEFQTNNPEIFKMWQSGKWKITSDWYKRLQTKYPWNLSITVDEGSWDGEYEAAYANTERYEVLSDQIHNDKLALKAVPNQIFTWLTNQDGKRYYTAIHLFPIPKFQSNSYYAPYYQDPNLTHFFKNFEDLFPKRSLATNHQPASLDEFATLKLHFNKELILQEAYLEKGNQKLPIDSAYHYSLAPVPEGGKYSHKTVETYYLTKPKTKDLSDPLFADIN